jgi:phosphate starvation-inducible protein PhoH
MCATYLALNDVLQKGEYEKVVIIRSAVQTREQGFMPGSQAQKEFKTSSFVRGLTFDNAVIIVDECQSMTYHELDSIITRVGESSKIIFCGDTKQDDLQQSRNRADITGLHDFIKVLDAIRSFDVVRFGVNDIVRSGLVKEYIIAKEQLLEAA